MKRIIKLLSTCIIAGLLLVTAAFPSFADDDELALYQQYIESLLPSITTVTEADYASAVEYYTSSGMEGIAKGFENWMEYADTIGTYSSVESCEVITGEDGSTTINAIAVFTNGKLDFTVVLDAQGYPTTFTFTKHDENAFEGLGKKMKDASVNLIVGMGTVFLVLIFLCWVISLFKNISIIEKKLDAAKAAKVKKAVKETKESAPVLPLTITPEPATDDELQAVIAAAIAAYESDNGSSIEKQPALNNGISIKTYRRN